MTKLQQLKYNDLLVALSKDFLKQTTPRYFNGMITHSSSKKLYKLFGSPITKALTKQQLYFYLTGLLKTKLGKPQFNVILNKLKNIKMITTF